ncbi:MAG TPA: hypothetical protein VKP04_06460 [Ktedonobacteraceae bacterium]|nr:hypothetical protein [Ktedonobacteraceae bacterium]
MSTQSTVLLPPGGERILVIMAQPNEGVEHRYRYGEAFHHMALT